MANLVLRRIYEQKSREFATQGQGSTRFENDFIDAWNYCAGLINVRADLSSEVNYVTDVESDTGLDQKFGYVVDAGLTFQLMKMGRRPAKGSEAIAERAALSWPDIVDDIRQNIVNVASHADTDDDTTDIIGLGTLGD